MYNQAPVNNSGMGMESEISMMRIDNNTSMQPMGQPVFIQQQPIYVQGQQPIVYQQVPIVQQQIYGGPQQIIYILPPGYGPNERARWGFDKLEQVDGIYIKQKFYVEEAFGCELENKYMVHALDRNGNNKGKPLFKCKEKSSLTSRYCLNADCRPFDMKVFHRDDNKMVDHEPFLFFKRDCKWTCCCFNRPEIEVTYVENGQSKYLGKVTQPWRLCDLEVQLHGAQNNMRYRVTGSCCQLGIWCQCPCEACQTVDFSIFDPLSSRVGTLQKRTAGFCVSALTSTSNFAVRFPERATKEDKALFIAATILIDFSYFEERPDDNNNNGGAWDFS